MKSTFSSIFISFNLIIFLSACTLSGQGGFKQSETGLLYKFHILNDTNPKASVNDIINVTMSYSLNDSVLFKSTDLMQPMQFPLMPPVFKGDFYEGIAMMHEGDSASFVCRADSVFLRIFRVKSMPSFVKSGDMMRFDIKLESFMSHEDFQIKKTQERQASVEQSENLLKGYLLTNNIQLAPTQSGLYYVETFLGKGKKPKKSQRVRVHYTGTLLDGTKFDSSVDRDKPLEFVLGANQVIKGWDEGISLMNEGGKARLIVPFHLAYGERGSGPIPPYSNLVFDVELIEIIK